MNIDHLLLIYELNKIGTSRFVDSSDLLNYHYTSLVFFLFCIFVSVKQYILKPIQCWVPPEFSRSWEDYAENFCWVQPTYIIPYEGQFPTANEEKQTFNYYQWVPFMLLLQMCISLFPFFLWTKISKNIGINFDSIMKIIKTERVKIESSERLNNAIIEIAEKLIRLFKSRLLSLDKRVNNKYCLRHCIVINSLIFGYFFIKIFFIFVACLQIVIMKYFIGNVRFTFGWDILVQLVKGKDWKKTNLFPRISGCDVTIRRSGKSITYSFVCALPINMLNEKIYIFLWFWMILCILFSFISLIVWLCKLLSMEQKTKLIQKLLINERGDTNLSTERIEKFIKSFLRLDGILIIEMISLRYGDIISASLLHNIFEAFEKDDNQILC